MRECILTITEHKLFGPLFIPCTATRDEHYWTEVERILERGQIPEEETDREIWQRIAGQSLGYSEQELLLRFGRPRELLVRFIERVEKSLIDNHIRPFIEKRMTEIFLIIREQQIPVYLMDRGINLWHTSAIYASKEATEIFLKFSRNEDAIIYRQNWALKGKPLNLTGSGARVIIKDPCLVLKDQELLWFIDPIDHHKIQPFFAKPEISIPRRAEKMWFEKFLTKTIQKFHVEAEGFEIEEIDGDPETVLYLEQDWQGRAVARPVFFYISARIMPASPSQVITRIVEKANGPGVLKIRRNFQKEKEMLQILLDLGLKELEPNSFIAELEDSTDTGNLTGNLIGWCSRNKAQISEAGIRINQDYFRNRFYLGRVDIRTSGTTHYDWFELHITVQFEGYEIPFVAFRKHILMRIREYHLPDDSVFLIPESWFSRFEDLMTFGQVHGEKIRIAAHYAGLLRNHGNLDHNVLQKVEQLTSEKYTPVMVPTSLKATLRDYQTIGYQWLIHLRKHGVNGCLADDMGLGKTIQTIAMLCHHQEGERSMAVRQHPSPATSGMQLRLFDMPEADEEASCESNNIPVRPALLVAPTTLLFNWRSELRRFAPHLKVIIYAGPKRKELIAELQSYDIVLTSYGIVRRDAGLLQGIQLGYLILDESQLIKNSGSKTYRALLTLQSEHRLALTGTPVENSLTDLYAQMHFLNRDMLGSLKFFKRHFLTPIMQEKDSVMHARAKEKLHDLISPFIMRRTKAEVAQELPPKTEQILLCRMTPEQEMIYDEEKSKVRNYIMEQIEKNTVARSSALIITALNRLRQIACHPAMVYPDSLAGSGKLETVVRNISVLLEEGHKILVISSYVRHLKIIGNWLNQNNISFTALTGKTKNHQEVIDRFKSREDIRLMLMTLKKGGYGLNLTEADYVMILDPWWNPASQQQGMDRVHRIGQDKPVFVYKFITRGTVEERILHMQKEKKRIADSVVGINNPLHYLTPETLEFLLDDRHP
ncbi:MAG: DEAD/DEAH box helicase [Bacteroidales bacterium]